MSSRGRRCPRRTVEELVAWRHALSGAPPVEVPQIDQAEGVSCRPCHGGGRAREACSPPETLSEVCIQILDGGRILNAPDRRQPIHQPRLRRGRPSRRRDQVVANSVPNTQPAFPQGTPVPTRMNASLGRNLTTSRSGRPIVQLRLRKHWGTERSWLGWCASLGKVSPRNRTGRATITSSAVDALQPSRTVERSRVLWRAC